MSTVRQLHQKNQEFTLYPPAKPCTAQLHGPTLNSHEDTLRKGQIHPEKSLGKGLASLPRHSIPQTECRSTLITQINFHLEANVLYTFHDILECCVEVSKQPTRNLAADSDIAAVWLLTVVFKRLVLDPNHDPDKSINQVVHERIRWFRSRQIEKIF